MKSKVLAILAVVACFVGLAYISANEPKAKSCCGCECCKCDPCDCESCDCCKCEKCDCKAFEAKAIVENPADDSAKGYITVFVPKDYKGWATSWVTPELKREYHYQVISTSSPLYTARFKGSVKHIPGIMVQRSNGAVVDEVYSNEVKASECCPLWKHRRKPWKKQEEQKQEEAPVDEEEEAAPAPPPPDHTVLWVLLGLGGAATGAAVAWQDRKAKKPKK